MRKVFTLLGIVAAVALLCVPTVQATGCGYGAIRANYVAPVYAAPVVAQIVNPYVPTVSATLVAPVQVQQVQTQAVVQQVAVQPVYAQAVVAPVYAQAIVQRNYGYSANVVAPIRVQAVRQRVVVQQQRAIVRPQLFRARAAVSIGY